ncbi:MAG: hypothetical protein LH477_10175 [Nocardioides sp.]|nr:hypothetical protein [Nocardioides sp.]
MAETPLVEERQRGRNDPLLGAVLSNPSGHSPTVPDDGTMCHDRCVIPLLHSSVVPISRLDAILPQPHFVERHQRAVHAPADVVWEAALSVTRREIRLLAPFMALRSLPQLVTGRRQRSLRDDDATFIEVFEDEGFVELHRDAQVTDGHAAAVYGAAGRFWSPSADAPVPLGDAEAFARHEDPGTVKAAFSLEVVERDGATLITTETRILGTDPASRRMFGWYWLIIRGPSGLIRRSWLAAIDRRTHA